ncbi:DgyrCDS14729 [Dimorphilus gyrociliatus]|uniref:DgyrCDS14729 n=1 Tax=Dimorphilus gyrociliatus TaxID=2664684 RepID=A0A7I8WET3_9ANNE|nr:DgyrCDS14729 [Dimorphilus gyrociliatus]
MILFQLGGSCLNNDDCLLNGRCINNTCHCDFPFDNQLCSMGSNYLYFKGILNYGKIISLYNLSSAVDCVEICKDSAECESVGLGIYITSRILIHCSLFSNSSYPIIPFPLNPIFRSYYIFIFKDSELSLCGNDQILTEHTEYCIEFLWQNITQCPISGYGFIDNLNDWLQINTGQYLKESMNNITSSTLSENKKNINTNMQSYRELCYGNLSAGSYNVALNKQVILSASILEPELIYHSQHIADGLKNSNVLLGGCTSMIFSSWKNSLWIGLDLKYKSSVKKAIIYLSNNQSQGQICDIFSSENYPSQEKIIPSHPNYFCFRNLELFSTSEELVVYCQPHTLAGQYFILQSESTGTITICELELYTSDLALNGEILSSSISGENYYGGFAVNENPNDNAFQTIPNEESWISVYLRKKFLIYGFNLFEINFQKLNVYVIERNFFLNQTFNEAEECISVIMTDLLYYNYIHKACKKILPGLFVALKSTHALFLRKIEIFGLFQSESEFENIAYGKPVWMTEISHDNYAYFATDGFSQTFYSQTKKTNQYMIVDLLEIFIINYTGVQMRSSDEVSSEKDRKRYLLHFKFFKKRRMTENSSNIFGSDCEEINDIQEKECGKTIIWNCSLKINIGRFIYVKSSQSKKIELKEFYAFGKKVESKLLSKNQIVGAFFNEDLQNNEFDYDKSPLKAIDGIVGGYTFPGFFSCTTLKSDRNDQLIIQLAKKFNISQILIQPSHDSKNGV